MEVENRKSPYDDRELEFEDLDTYRGDKVTFNHESDVAKAISRVQKAGSQEMKAGWHEFKKDPRSGETIASKYHSDTREEFIECVNSFISILISELNNNPKFFKQVEDLQDEKEEAYDKWLKIKNEAWDNLKRHIKIKTPNDHLAIPPTSFYYREYMKEMIKISRQIEIVLHSLIAELQFFKSTENQNLTTPKRMDED